MLSHSQKWHHETPDCRSRLRRSGSRAQAHASYEWAVAEALFVADRVLVMEQDRIIRDLSAVLLPLTAGVQLILCHAAPCVSESAGCHSLIMSGITQTLPPRMDGAP